MRTRWMLAAFSLVLALACLPGALHAAGEPGCAPAAVSAAAIVAAVVPAPAAPALPVWAAPELLSSSPQSSAAQPLSICSLCGTRMQCIRSRSCVLNNCC